MGTQGLWAPPHSPPMLLLSPPPPCVERPLREIGQGVKPGLLSQGIYEQSRRGPRAGNPDSTIHKGQAPARVKGNIPDSPATGRKLTPPHTCLNRSTFAIEPSTVRTSYTLGSGSSDPRSPSHLTYVRESLQRLRPIFTYARLAYGYMRLIYTDLCT